jgi:hypothetical protein
MRRQVLVSGWVPMGAIKRVEVEPQPVATSDRRTPTERLADIYLAAHERREAEARAEEQRKVDEWNAKRRREQREADRKRRQGEFAMTELLIEDTITRHGLTPTEKSIVMQALLDGQYTADRAEILCAEIAANRQRD